VGFVLLAGPVAVEFLSPVDDGVEQHRDPLLGQSVFEGIVVVSGDRNIRIVDQLPVA